MKIIKVNDVLTMDDDKDYLVLKILDLSDGNYYLLSKLEDDEMTDDAMIVVENSDGTLSQVDDESKVRRLNELFISALK